MNNKLFQESTEDNLWQLNACVGENTGSPDNSIGYAGGFQSAAEILLKQAGVSKPKESAETWGIYPLVDMIVYPILYCARHHVELDLKRILPKITFLNNYRKNITKASNPTTESKETITHSVLNVFGKIENLSKSTDPRLIEYVEKIRPYVLEIESIDQSGQTFRYAIDSENSKLHLAEISRINLQSFANGYSKLCEILEEFDILATSLEIEYRTNTMTKELNREQLLDIAKSLPNRNEWSESKFQEIAIDIKKKYNLSSRGFHRACCLIQKNIALSHHVGIIYKIEGLCKETLIKLHSTPKNSFLDFEKLTEQELSAILGILDIGLLRNYPDNFEHYLIVRPEDIDPIDYNNERDQQYIARRVSSRPDAMELGLILLGQQEILLDFQLIYQQEIKNLKDKRENSAIDKLNYSFEKFLSQSKEKQ